MKLSEYIEANDDLSLPTGLHLGEILRDIKKLEAQNAALLEALKLFVAVDKGKLLHGPIVHDTAVEAIHKTKEK